MDYIGVKNFVIAAGYGREIEWQANVRFEDLTEQLFLSELAWVVLCSGMRVAVVRQKFPAIKEAFHGFAAAELIDGKSVETALRYFNNRQKMEAIKKAAYMVSAYGWPQIKEAIEKDPIGTLRRFPYIGPVIVYHLAKNIGVQVAKPDRHLVRIADHYGYSDVQKFCEDVSKKSGDPVPVVDIVYWRFATLEPDYLRALT